MIRCPNCQHEEIEGALFCGECGAQLFKAEKGSTLSFRPMPTDRFKEVTETPTVPVPQPVSEAAVSLYVMDAGQMLPLVGREEFTLGRSAEGQPILPDIDLTPFRAYENGVSRLHASIKLAGTQVIVTDLGSVNGTRINNQRVQPNKPSSISHGDVVALGKLKLQLVVRR